MTSDLITKNYDSKIKPYVMLGGGQAKYESDDTAGNVGTESTDTIGNVGLGVF